MTAIEKNVVASDPGGRASPRRRSPGKIVCDWLDDRTGYRALFRPITERVLPNGPGWWYTSASCLFWLLIIQIITGFLLMTTYSPSTTSAWASVHYIEQMPAGTFIRGLHHFASHAMIALFAIHIVRVLMSGAFRAPRELIWITGLFLMPLMIVWAVTGNPLSASQKGMAQIEVEGNILGSTPWVGTIFKRLLVGGDEVGHLTLTHLYFLHVGLIPLLGIVLLVVHVTQVFRHGLSPRGSPPLGPLLPYWPYQSVRNFAVLSVLVGLLAALAWKLGAPLDAPADSNLPNLPRPEWYFRSLFELRRYFTGDWEFVATMVVPGAVLGMLLAIPVLDRICSQRVSRALRVTLICAMFAGWGGLTSVSYWRDWTDPDFANARLQSGQLALRARELADRGRIPPEGAITLLRGDFQTQGPLLFAKHCAVCHPYTDSSGRGIPTAKPSAANLYRFGSAEWITGMLDSDHVATEQYFGRTKFADGEMTGKVKELFEGVEGDALSTLRNQLALVARTLASEGNQSANPPGESNDETELASGRELITGQFACTDCHKFHEYGELGTGPDLTGYGSTEWLTGMISNPTGQRFYPDERNDRMPAFASDSAHPEQNLLGPHELTMIVEWLRQRGNNLEPSGFR